MAPVVYLLRHASPGDAYVETLRQAGFVPVVVPVLAFTLVNEASLRRHLSSADAFGGLILTSPRAAEALGAHRDVLRSWLRKPAYCVGPATAQAATALGLQSVGAEAGSAEALVTRIIATAPARPLLFCSGHRRRETLPRLLSRANVDVLEQVVYETHLTNVAPPPNTPAPNVVVFFSPTGVDAVAASVPAWLGACPSVAIGPTTAGALASQQGEAPAVAPEPTPAGVLAACRLLFPDIHRV